jgi:DNA-binding transcriptional regulator YiaG
MTDRKIAHEVLDSLQDYAKHVAGKPHRGRVTVVRVPDAVDVKRIRAALHLTQDEFARRYALPLTTVRKWEQGVRKPDCASRAYLTLIFRIPKAVEETLAEG